MNGTDRRKSKSKLTDDGDVARQPITGARAIGKVGASVNSKPKYCIFTADGKRHVVEAPSLRTALRGFDESQASVVAACEVGCMPAASAEDRPFLAVFLKSPNFVPPEDVG